MADPSKRRQPHPERAGSWDAGSPSRSSPRSEVRRARHERDGNRRSRRYRRAGVPDGAGRASRIDILDRA